MALEIIDAKTILMQPGPADIHMHPRVFDAITDDDFGMGNGQEGKAGLREYTKTALRSGIVLGAAMSNESMRLFSPTGQEGEQTQLVPYPTSNRDRVFAALSAFSSEAYIPMAQILGVDPEEIYFDKKRETLNEIRLYERFMETKEEIVALKLYGDETTGGYNVRPRHIPCIAQIWHNINREKPVILHLEDETVGNVLHKIAELPVGKIIPVHIAHVSSRQELESVIESKRAGMNVTCEVTPHHLMLDESVTKEIGGYGCMKPSLKSKDDIAFIRANLKYIDVFASDCAPHRRSDKEAVKPAYGVTNHTVMLPILFAMVEEGLLTHKELYQKVAIEPRRLLNLSFDDGSFAEFETSTLRTAKALEDTIRPVYGHNPFIRTAHEVALKGVLLKARAGRSSVGPNGEETLRTSYTHMVTPKTLGVTALGKSAE